MDKRKLLPGVILIIIGVILGAFGAHALKDFLSVNDKVDSYLTATRYLIYGGFSQLSLVFIEKMFQMKVVFIKRLNLVGTALFSFSIFILIGSPESIDKMVGILTPIGGVLIISSWLLLLFRIYK